MVLADGNYTGFAAHEVGQDAIRHERRENEGNSERERGRDRQMLAEVEFIGR